MGNLVFEMEMAGCWLLGCQSMVGYNWEAKNQTFTLLASSPLCHLWQLLMSLLQYLCKLKRIMMDESLWLCVFKLEILCQNYGLCQETQVSLLWYSVVNSSVHRGYPLRMNPHSLVNVHPDLVLPSDLCIALNFPLCSMTTREITQSSTTLFM